MKKFKKFNVIFIDCREDNRIIKIIKKLSLKDVRKSFYINDAILTSRRKGLLTVFRRLSRQFPYLTFKLKYKEISMDYGTTRTLEIKDGIITDFGMEPLYLYHFLDEDFSRVFPGGLEDITRIVNENLAINDSVISTEDGKKIVKYEEFKYYLNEEGEYRIMLVKFSNHIHVLWEKKLEPCQNPTVHKERVSNPFVA